eukprot:scaffold24891_cov32-Tisochrysis_lutea.AAC.3
MCLHCPPTLSPCAMRRLNGFQGQQWCCERLPIAISEQGACRATKYNVRAMVWFSHSHHYTYMLAPGHSPSHISPWAMGAWRSLLPPKSGLGPDSRARAYIGIRPNQVVALGRRGRAGARHAKCEESLTY